MGFGTKAAGDIEVDGNVWNLGAGKTTCGPDAKSQEPLH